MGPAPPGGPLVDIGEPMMSHGNTVRSIGGRQDPNRGHRTKSVRRVTRGTRNAPGLLAIG